jgi:phospholipid transport system substrate-binding protein
MRTQVAQQNAGIDMRRRQMIGLAALGAAALAFGIRGAHAAETNDAVAPVQQLDAALLRAMQAGRATPFTQRFAMVAPAIDAAFDLPTILRTSVGPRWATLSADDQVKLEAVFRNYTIASYVANFDHYNGQTLDVSVARTVPGGEQVVDSKLGGTTLSYVMRQTPAGWRAVDILADGSISRVAVQRSDFRSTIAAGGGPALVARLQSKVSDLSGGSLA